MSEQPHTPVERTFRRGEWWPWLPEDFEAVVVCALDLGFPVHVRLANGQRVTVKSRPTPTQTGNQPQ